MGCLKPWPCVLLTRVNSGPATRFQMRHLSEYYTWWTTILAYIWIVLIMYLLQASGLSKLSELQMIRGLSKEAGICQYYINAYTYEMMINAIHFWDLILFKFFLIYTLWILRSLTDQCIPIWRFLFLMIGILQTPGHRVLCSVAIQRWFRWI